MTVIRIDVNWINQFDCDVVHLHWINNNMLSIRDIARIKKPIVWTMHDRCPCCGVEHHPNVLENETRGEIPKKSQNVENNCY